MHSGRCRSLEYQFQHKRTANSAVWLGMARPVPYTCSQLYPPGSGSHGQLQLVFASYPDVSLFLSMKMCAQRKAGRRKRARRRFACCLYSSHGSFAVHHQSLAFRARLYNAKNEAQEAELVLFRKDPRNPGEYQDNFIRGGSQPPRGPAP